MRNNNLIHFDFMVVNYKTVPLTRNNKLVFFYHPTKMVLPRIYQLLHFWDKNLGLGVKNIG